MNRQLSRWMVRRPHATRMNAPVRQTRKWFSICALPVLLTLCAFSQNPGGPPQSIVFYSAREGNLNQIYVMDPDGSNQNSVILDTASDTDPDISSNGKYIAFKTSPPGPKGTASNILIESLWSGAVWNVTDDTSLFSANEWPRFSPDGKQVVYDHTPDTRVGVYTIYVADVDGDDPPTALALGRYPSWSPDGKQIVFRSVNDIAVVNANGTSKTPTLLTHESAGSFAQMANWSPDGGYIAFMSFREGYCSVFRMKADSSEQTNLTPKDPADAPAKWCSRAPAWSTNGQEIFFMSFRPSTGGQSEVFVMNMDGTNVRQLTNDGTSGEPRAR